MLMVYIDHQMFLITVGQSATKFTLRRYVIYLWFWLYDFSANKFTVKKK
jgi:hypothetical protein